MPRFSAGHDAEVCDRLSIGATIIKQPDFISPEDHPTVELVKNSYQPSKAKLEEEIPPLDLPGDSPMEKFQHALKVLSQPVNVTFLRRPKS